MDRQVDELQGVKRINLRHRHLICDCAKADNPVPPKIPSTKTH
jgi:hypothetical protein